MSEIVKEEEMSFEEMLNQSFKSTYTGERVKAIVTGIAPNEITVDIGTKHTGYVPLSELTSDPSLKPEDIVKKGDEIELVVLRVNDVEGTVMLSKKRLDAQAGFEKVMAAAGTGEVLSGTVTDVVKASSSQSCPASGFKLRHCPRSCFGSSIKNWAQRSIRGPRFGFLKPIVIITKNHCTVL